MMVNICLFGILTGLSGIAMSTIDKFMINSMIDLSATGIYSVAFYFSVLILIPSKSVRNISLPFVAEFMKKKDFKGIHNIYLKSSINQLVLGFLLFIGIWANIHNVFKILPPEYEAGKYVIFFMMLAKLFELATGVANIVIATSRYYRVQTYFMIILLVLIIVSNLIFIPIYGIVGAAMASAISSFVFNFLRFIFVYRKFKMQPFNLKSGTLLIITTVSYVASFVIPVFPNFILDILIRSIFITIIFGSLIMLFRVSDEVNEGFNSIIAKLKIRK